MKTIGKRDTYLEVGYKTQDGVFSHNNMALRCTRHAEYQQHSS